MDIKCLEVLALFEHTRTSPPMHQHAPGAPQRCVAGQVERARDALEAVSTERSGDRCDGQCAVFDRCCGVVAIDGL